MAAGGRASGQHALFSEKRYKNMSKGFSGTNAISITSGIFHLTLNYKPDFFLTKLQRRPLTHNYVVWIMAVCMKYKRLDITDFFLVLCVLKKLRKITEYIWDLSAKVHKVQKHVNCEICFDRKIEMPCLLHIIPPPPFTHTHTDIWYIATDVVLISKRNLWQMLLWLNRCAFCYLCWNLENQRQTKPIMDGAACYHRATFSM